jgi:hypothetical protein
MFCHKKIHLQSVGAFATFGIDEANLKFQEFLV